MIVHKVADPMSNPEVVLKIPSNIGALYRCMTVSYWDKLKDFIKNNDILMSVSDSDNDLYDSANLLQRIEVISDPKKVADFKTIHGDRFDLFENLISQYQASLPVLVDNAT